MVSSTIKLWFPRITICPVNYLPDIIFISVEFRCEFKELYGIRKQMKKAVPHFSKMYMEDVAKRLCAKFPDYHAVEVRLLFNKHIVRIENELGEIN